MKKGFILGFTIATILTAGIVFASEMLSNVYISQFPIQLNGQNYVAEMPVLNYQGRTYLALREFGTVTGNEIDFKDNTIIINNIKSNNNTQNNSSENNGSYTDEDGIITIHDISYKGSKNMTQMSFETTLNKDGIHMVAFTISLYDDNNNRIDHADAAVFDMSKGKTKTSEVFFDTKIEDVKKAKTIKVQIDLSN